MQTIRGNLSGLLLILVVFVLGVGLSLAAAAYIEQEARSSAQRLFEREATSATTEIEREIERHVQVVEETVAFAEATWPGSVDEWRDFTHGRVTGGTHLAFTSTAGVLERVPADQIAAFEAREAATSASPISLVELTPLPPAADRLVLTRTAEETTDGVQIRGLEVSSVATMLGVELPRPGDGIAVDSIDATHQEVLDVLSIERTSFGENDVLNSNVMLSHAIGAADEEPLGWVIIPAELGNLLIGAIDNLYRTEVNLAIAIPGTELDGDLGRYEGDPGLVFDNAALTSEETVDFGGWEWRVRVWADTSFAMSQNGVRGDHVLLGGLVLTFTMIAFLLAQRRYRRKLEMAEFEANLNRALAETDPLTGLANRQGLQTFVQSEPIRPVLDRDGCASFFLDLDGFKQINDDLGHAAGDALLTKVGRAISGTARVGDGVGRIGGDEFVVICPGLADALSADDLARRLADAIASIDDPAAIDASIGVALSKPGRRFNFDAALLAADEAMYTAKKDRKPNGHRWHMAVYSSPYGRERERRVEAADPTAERLA